MKAQAVSIVDCADLDVLSVAPVRELEPANRWLDDHAALTAFYLENGYILLRDVLDRQSVAEACAAMRAVLARHGLVDARGDGLLWTGTPFLRTMEDSPEFAGIASGLVQHSGNREILSRIQGEPACVVPVVKYRTYPPGWPPTIVHQEGFFSPGIVDYKGLWVPLADCPKARGGLMLAIGQHNRGYFHNLAKPPQFPIPAGVIPSDSWGSADYFPGDMVIFHPAIPHASMPNTSDSFRVSLDIRLQSASAPRTFVGNVSAVTASSVTLEAGQDVKRTFEIDEDTVIRVIDDGTHVALDEFPRVTQRGMRLIAIFDGNRALTLRKAYEG